MEGTGDLKLKGCVRISGVSLPWGGAGVWGEGHMVTADDARLSKTQSPLSSSVTVAVEERGGRGGGGGRRGSLRRVGD